MNEQLQEIYDNAEKAGACSTGLEWLTQFETFKEAEQDSEAPEFFLWYAENVIRERWELGEKAISKSAYISYLYACDVLKTRFALGEKAISKDFYCSYYYACDVLKGKFQLGEKVISKDFYYSYYYARDVLKTRFALGEKAISKDAYYKDQYKKFLDEISTFDQERV